VILICIKVACPWSLRLSPWLYAKRRAGGGLGRSEGFPPSRLRSGPLVVRLYNAAIDLPLPVVASVEYIRDVEITASLMDTAKKEDEKVEERIAAAIRIRREVRGE
jgi:hypothetical protein